MSFTNELLLSSVTKEILSNLLLKEVISQVFFCSSEVHVSYLRTAMTLTLITVCVVFLAFLFSLGFLLAFYYHDDKLPTMWISLCEIQLKLPSKEYVMIHFILPFMQCYPISWL